MRGRTPGRTTTTTAAAAAEAENLIPKTRALKRTRRMPRPPLRQSPVRLERRRAPCHPVRPTLRHNPTHERDLAPSSTISTAAAALQCCQPMHRLITRQVKPLRDRRCSVRRRAIVSRTSLFDATNLTQPRRQTEHAPRSRQSKVSSAILREPKSCGWCVPDASTSMKRGPAASTRPTILEQANPTRSKSRSTSIARLFSAGTATLLDCSFSGYHGALTRATPARTPPATGKSSSSRRAKPSSALTAAKRTSCGVPSTIRPSNKSCGIRLECKRRPAGRVSRTRPCLPSNSRTTVRRRSSRCASIRVQSTERRPDRRRRFRSRADVKLTCRDQLPAFHTSSRNRNLDPRRRHSRRSLSRRPARARRRRTTGLPSGQQTLSTKSSALLPHRIPRRIYNTVIRTRSTKRFPFTNISRERLPCRLRRPGLPMPTGRCPSVRGLPRTAMLRTATTTSRTCQLSGSRDPLIHRARRTRTALVRHPCSSPPKLRSGSRPLLGRQVRTRRGSYKTTEGSSRCRDRRGDHLATRP